MDDSSCRVCLTRASNKSLSVFNEVNDVSIDEKLQFVTGIVINQDDPFSKFMCLKCFTDTNTAYNLKSRCLDANQTLNNQLKLQNPFQDFSFGDETVKAEPIDAHLDPIVFIEPVAIKAEFIEEWTQPNESVSCLDLKLEDTREEITTKQVTPKRKKANSSQSKKSQLNTKVPKYSSCIFKGNRPKDLDKRLQTSLQSLTAHMKNGHEARNIYKCTEINCDYSTKSDKQFSNHISRHSNVPKCKDCDASFSSITKLLNHRKSEHPETFDQNEKQSISKKLMPCDICGKLMRSKHMSDHKESVHLKTKRFECDFCGKKIYYKKSIINHLSLHIPEEFRSQTFKCEICHRNFYTRPVMKLHMSQNHNATESEFPCHCGKTFKRQQYLNIHIRNVHQQMKPVCKICGKSYFDQFSLREHIKIAHTKNYQKKFMCNNCGKLFYRQCVLNRHQKRVHEERLFICKYPGCEKKFTFRFEVSEHEKNSHLKIKNFICTEPNCNKSFIKRVSFMKHNKISHEKISENCPVGNGCKFSVGRIDYMRNHVKKHSELSREKLDKYLEIIKQMNLV